MQGRFFFASHSLEALSNRLAEYLENQPSLFSPPLIVIPHPSMKEWLQLELCKSGKKKAIVGLEFGSWRQALQHLAGPLPVPSRLELSAAVWQAGRQLNSSFSEHVVAQLTEVFGECIDGFSLETTEESAWERGLFEEILRTHGWKTYVEALEKMALSKRDVILFAMDFLPPKIHQFFLKLPALQVYKFSPCAMFWEDFCSAAEKRRILRKWEKKGVSSNQLQSLDDLLRDSQRLLANWGMIGRKMWVECDAETNYELEDKETLLNALKFDLLFLEKPISDIDPDDPSIQCVKTGASRFQEIQWLKEEILKIVSGGVPFSEIRVYAPDISSYVPIIEYTFDQIPFRIANVDLAPQSGVTQAILQMFQCVKGRWEASFILELFQRPAFHRKMGWQPEEILRIREWIQIGRVRWGIDSAHKKETTDVEGATNSNGSWENGWNEMFDSLIYLHPEKKSVIGWGEIDLFESFIETFGKLQKTLLSWREEKTLATWANEIHELILWTLELDEELETDRAALSAFYNFIDGLRKTSRAFPEEKFPFSWIEMHFFSSSGEEGRSLLHAVRFASLTPGAIVPAKVIFLIGMDEESFPRQNLSPQRKLKDAPSLSDFDRYLFLQAIFCAKDRLIFSYGDCSKEDGGPMPSSLLLQELFSYLDSAFSYPHGKKPSIGLIQKGEISEPLYLGQSQSLLSNATKVPDLVSGSRPFIGITIRELNRFFRHPPKVYLEQVLGIEFKEELPSLWKDYELSSLDRHLLRKFSLGQERLLETEMPLGMFGVVAKKNLDSEADEFQEHLESWGIDPASISSLRLDGMLEGVIPYVVPEGALHLGADDIGGLFRKWPELLAALAETGTNKIFCLRTGRVRSVVDPKKALQLAIDLFLRCQGSFCFLHAEWVDAVLRKNSVPELDSIQDPTLRWMMRRSPQFDLGQELRVWQSTFAETFSSLTALFPLRGQEGGKNAEI